MNIFTIAFVDPEGNDNTRKVTDGQLESNLAFLVQQGIDDVRVSTSIVSREGMIELLTKKATTWPPVYTSHIID